MITVGRITIIPVFEIEAGQVIQDGIPDATPQALKAIDWLRPDYVDDDGGCKAQVQAFLVEAGGKKIVIDGCCGDGRERPGLPEWGHLQTGFMDRFKKIWQPQDVDIVLCTHMHFDHVGWNTTWQDGDWVPTFSNAKYIFSQREFDYWNGNPQAEMQDDRMGFAESILPVHRAGLTQLVADNYRVSPEVSFIPTPGHTPGHISILLESNGRNAVITGDAMHHPCQIAHPEWGTPFDTNTEQANESRKKLLQQFAGSDTVFVGSHFADPVAGKVEHDGNGFKLVKE